MSNTVPEGWDFCRLDKLVSRFMVPMRDKPKEFSGSTPWVRIEDFDGKYLYESKSKRCVDKNTIEEMKLKVYPSGTVLCSCSARLGVCTIAGAELVSNQTFIGLVPSPSAISSEFLFYRMQSHADDLQKLSSGTTIAYLSREKFEEFEVLAPPLPEQQKIAAILSSVDDVIEKTRAQIDKLKDLKTGMMQELLTKGIGHTTFKDSPVGRIPEVWRVVPLDMLVKEEKKITYGIVQAGPHHENGIPYIRVSDMTQRELSLGGMLRTSPEIAEKYRRSSVSVGDLVYALRGVIGHVQIVPSELDGANLTQGTARISPNESILGRYLLWAMRSPYVQLQNELEAKGSTFREVTLASLRNIQIALPKTGEQERIADIMDGIEQRIQSHQDKLEGIEALKKGLMQDLLTGKVRVNVDNKENAVA